MVPCSRELVKMQFRSYPRWQTAPKVGNGKPL